MTPLSPAHKTDSVVNYHLNQHSGKTARKYFYISVLPDGSRHVRVCFNICTFIFKPQELSIDSFLSEKQTEPHTLQNLPGASERYSPTTQHGSKKKNKNRKILLTFCQPSSSFGVLCLSLKSLPETHLTTLLSY